MEFQMINRENFLSILENQVRPWHRDYLAMYSTQWPGFTTDPNLMMIPIDDHLVHRGDGVFEVIRCVRGRIYQLEEHLRRLERSAKAISLDLPLGLDDIVVLIKRLVGKGGHKECLIRIIISRGPGSFSIDPHDSIASQVYANVIRFRDVPESYYQHGISIITSSIPIKKSFFANIKSCNYLPNVLMKMEAIQAGCKFSVALDEQGFLAEGSTENIGVLTSGGILKFPGFERTLSGITVKRVFQLAQAQLKGGMVKDVRFDRITPEEAYKAKEMFLTGTSLNLLPVVKYDGRTIGQGSPGPVYLKLSSILWEDMTLNQQLLTDIDLGSKT